jgi:hypothetical protein
VTLVRPRQCARSSHERIDGKGYPDRLAGEGIHLYARIMAVADSFDAMTSARAYRPPLTMAEAVQELRDKAGTQFHPLVAHAFSSMIEGQPLQSAIGQSQLAALRAEFSRIPTLPSAASTTAAKFARVSPPSASSNSRLSITSRSAKNSASSILKLALERPATASTS